MTRRRGDGEAVERCVALIDHGKGLPKGDPVRVEGDEHHYTKRIEPSMHATWHQAIVAC